MLLLFWNTRDKFRTGKLTSVYWYYDKIQSPWCFCSTSGGMDFIKPWYGSKGYCSHILTNVPVSCVTLFDEKIIFGTLGSGIYAVNYSIVRDNGCYDTNLSTKMYEFITTESGISSNNIVSIDANSNFLGVVTYSGLDWIKRDSDSIVNYPTTSGRDVVIGIDGSTFFADGSSLKIKYGQPTDYTIWDFEYTFSGSINKLRVNNNCVFVGTEYGAYVVNPDSNVPICKMFNLGNNIVSIAIEQDSNCDWGHLFTATSDYVYFNNLKLYTTYSGVFVKDEIVDIEFPRL